MTDDIRTKIIDEVVKDAKKKFGEDSLVSFTHGEKVVLTSAIKNTISCGAINVDRITCKDQQGNYGFPRGRIIYITGPESCGKTTLALEFAAVSQKDHNAIVYYIDQEHALDLWYAKKIGFNKEQAIIAQPDSVERSIEIISNTLDKYEDIAEKYGVEKIPPVVIIWDTFSASPTNKELETGKTSGGGEHARLSSGMMRKWTKRVGKYQMILLILNQQKASIRMGWFGRGGPKDTFLGEKPQKFHSSIGFKMVRIGWIKGAHKKKIGITTLVKNDKNKTAIPFREAEINIYFGKGIDKDKSLFETLLAKGLVKKKKKLWHIEGYDEFKYFNEFLGDNNERRKELLGLISAPKLKEK